MAFDERYRRQVALLMRVLPHVADEKCFALKGGTAINLFIRDMPRLSVDIDLTYLPVAPEARAWMHASGAIASKIGPFIALAFWPASGAPGWAAWAILGYGLLIIGTDVFISTRKSDWKRFRREMHIVRVQAANR